MILKANADSNVECWKWYTDKSRVWRHIGMIPDPTTFKGTFPIFFCKSYNWMYSRYSTSFIWAKMKQSVSWNNKNWRNSI